MWIEIQSDAAVLTRAWKRPVAIASCHQACFGFRKGDAPSGSSVAPITLGADSPAITSSFIALRTRALTLASKQCGRQYLK